MPRQLQRWYCYPGHCDEATNPLIDDRFAESAGTWDPADVDIADAPWSLQRMADLLAARTRYFDAFICDAWSTGSIRQAVILAAEIFAPRLTDEQRPYVTTTSVGIATWRPGGRNTGISGHYAKQLGTAHQSSQTA